MTEEGIRERKYIRKYFYKTTPRWMLVFPASDTYKLVYIRSSKDIEELYKIRADLQEKQYTEQELLEHKKDYKRCVKEEVVEPHIRRKQNGTYNVFNKKKSYGHYKSVEEAREIRDKLIRTDWDEELAGVHVKRRDRMGINRHIQKEGAKYTIKKMINGKPVRFETGIPTIEEARMLRDEWENLDWNWENLDLV